MGKTNAIIEILVMGLIAFIGILLNVIGFMGVEKAEFMNYVTDFKSYSNILLLIVLAISYQLGWIVNGLTSSIYPQALRNKAKVKHNIPLNEYHKIRDIVYLKASDNALSKIKERLSGIRLLRSSIINILIFIIGFLVLKQYAIVFFLFFPLLVISAIITHNMYDKYTGQLIHTYKQLIDKKENDKIIS